MAKQITKKPVVKKAIKKQIKKQRPLTIKQRRFIEEVTKSWNATEAASKVYKTKNNNSAWVIWSQNLRKLNIKDSIEERVNKCKNVIYWFAISEEEKAEVRIKAAQDVIDRVEWKALARTQLSWELKIISEDELME